MKQFRILLLLVTAIVYISATPIKGTYTVTKEYTVSIHGTSNLHSWDETVKDVSGSSTINWNSDGSFDMETMVIKMEVRSIKSDMGSAMNNNTYKALKADACPEITFTLTTPIKSIPAKAYETVFTAKGNLTIAGVTKPVDMQVKVYMPKQGELVFDGSQTIKMTDYGVAPPVAMFGTLKTGNEITISFKTCLQ